MTLDGNSEYRLRDLERRLAELEREGSRATQILKERLANEMVTRLEADKAQQADITRVDNILTNIVRGAVVLVTSGAVSVVVFILTNRG